MEDNFQPNFLDHGCSVALKKVNSAYVHFGGTDEQFSGQFLD